MTRSAFHFILATTLLGVSGCASLGRKAPVADHVVKARQLSQQGMTAYHRGRWQVAMDKLKAAVMTCPDDCEARKNYADMLQRNGNIPAAIEQLESAVSGDAGAASADTLVRLGQLYLEAGNAAQAFSLANEAITKDPTTGGAWSLKGRAQFENGKFETALSSLQRAVSLGDDSLVTQTTIAETYHRLGRPRRTLTTIQAISEHVPIDEHPQQLLHLKGRALAALERPAEAAEAFQVAAKKGEPSAELMHDLAKAMYRSEQYAAADWAVRQAVELEGGAASRKLLAEIETVRNLK